LPWNQKHLGEQISLTQDRTFVHVKVCRAKAYQQFWQ